MIRVRIEMNEGWRTKEKNCGVSTFTKSYGALHSKYIYNDENNCKIRIHVSLVIKFILLLILTY